MSLETLNLCCVKQTRANPKKYLDGVATLKQTDMVLPIILKPLIQILGDAKSQRASKLRHWIKSYRHSAEWWILPIGGQTF